MELDTRQGVRDKRSTPAWFCFLLLFFFLLVGDSAGQIAARYIRFVWIRQEVGGIKEMFEHRGREAAACRLAPLSLLCQIHSDLLCRVCVNILHFKSSLCVCVLCTYGAPWQCCELPSIHSATQSSSLWQRYSWCLTGQQRDSQANGNTHAGLHMKERLSKYRFEPILNLVWSVFFEVSQWDWLVFWLECDAFFETAFFNSSPPAAADINQHSLHRTGCFANVEDKESWWF